MTGISPSAWSEHEPPDWSEKDQVRARMRATIRRLLTRYGYPPDKKPPAIELVMQQAELWLAPREKTSTEETRRRSRGS